MNMKTPLKYTTSLVCLLISIGCVSQSPETGGKTNWLSRCDEAADCDGLTDAVCAEHICTQRCESAESCVVVGEDLACLTSDDDNTRVCTACAGENCASLDAGETTQSDEPTVEQGSEPSLADTTPEAGTAQSSSDDSVVDSSEDSDVEEAGVSDSSDDVEEAGVSDSSDDVEEAGVSDSSDDIEEAGVAETSDTGVTDAPDCVGPDNPGQAYECGVTWCSCTEAEDLQPTCVEGLSDGVRFAFSCRDGHYTAVDRSQCATDTSICFSPTENVALALTGTIQGCECNEDDFDCGIEGDLRVPMDCGTGRWVAEEGPAVCEGTSGDLCSGISDQ